MRISYYLACATRHLQRILGNDERNIVRLDRIALHVKAGRGGHGMMKYDGVGGDGGNVYFMPVPDMPFMKIKQKLNGKYHVRAEPGGSSAKLKLVGTPGQHEIFNIPLGVDIVRRETGEVLARCNKMFQKFLVARGGKGGNYKNNYQGEPGEELNILLHLKLRPNVGLVGFPNAGKSTILKSFIPQKSVKIAAYPFTTLKPQIGFWKADEKEDVANAGEPFVLTLADLPGLIVGAAENRGRGHEFLKHLEYADVLLFVIDCTGFQMGDLVTNPWRSPLECVAILNCELENYLKRLTKKPCVVVLNKTDLVKEEEVSALCSALSSNNWHRNVSEDIRPQHPIRFDAVTTSSAKFGKIDDLKEQLIRVYKTIHFDTAEEFGLDFGDEKDAKKKKLI